jgi:hypothetical protein
MTEDGDDAMPTHIILSPMSENETGGCRQQALYIW